MVSELMSLEVLERQAYSGKYQQFFTTLELIFSGLEARSISLRSEEAATGASDEIIAQTYCRMAAAITSMLSDPNFVLNDRGFETLVLQKRNITSLFSGTPFRTMGHIRSIVGERDADGDVKFESNSALLKMLFTCTVDDDFPQLQLLMEKLPIRTRTIFWLSMLDRSFLLDESGEQRRNQLINFGHLVEQGDLPQHLLVRLSNVWMSLSYYNYESKHDLKVPLNRILRNSVRKLGVKQPAISNRSLREGKPKLAVLVEWFTSSHAMYRCYAWAVKQLGEVFTLVLVGYENKIDQKSRDMFDEVVSFPATTSLSKIIGKLVKMQPDVIYYPSLGMDLWTITAAQLRLAPIQLMTLGHPATSMSEHIDYVVVMEPAMRDPDCFSETVVLTDKDAFAFSRHPEYLKVPKAEINLKPEKIKIAVPCSFLKINSDFLRCCSDIFLRSSKPVEFHIFPNATEVDLLALKFNLEKLFPCVLYSGSDYVTYMKNIGQCDIQLSSFPFGNTNGYIDGLLAGLPIVSMGGREVHSHADNIMGRLAGLPEYCLTTTEEEYVDGVLRLVENDAERVAVSEKLLATDLQTLFFNTEVSSDFCDAVKWIYENHEQIQEKDKKCWSIEDRNLVGQPE